MFKRGEFNIMMNCVLTQARTDTRCVAMARSAFSGSNRGETTVGQPSEPGEKCAVQSPNPKGAGTAPKKTSSGVSSPDSVANWWK